MLGLVTVFNIINILAMLVENINILCLGHSRCPEVHVDLPP